MLCPNCGADVGERIQLCSKCEEARLKRLEESLKKTSSEQEKRNTGASKVTAAEKTASDKVEKSAADSWRVVTIFVVTGLLLGLAIYGLYLLLQRDSNEQPIDEAQQADNKSAVAILSNNRLRLGSTIVQLDKGVAAYVPSKRELRLAFYQSSTTDNEIVDGLFDDKIDKFVALLVVRYRLGAQSCDLSLAESAKLFVKSSEGELRSVKNSLIFDVLSKSTDADGGPSSFALNSLNCEFKAGAQLSMSIRGSQRIFVNDDPKDFNWELEMRSELQFPPPTFINYSSSMAHSVVGLWDPVKRSLNIGYYGKEINTEERSLLHSSNSLFALPENQPDVVVLLDIADGENYLKEKVVRTYSISFVRGASQQFQFPGEGNRFTLMYAADTKSDAKLNGLTGVLADKGQVSGNISGAVAKRIGEVEAKFAWDLSFNLALMGINE